MKTIKVSRSHHNVIQALTRKDIAALKKHPKILAESKQLLRAFKTVIRKIEGIPEHANRRKRQTAYKRIIGVCRKAIDQFDN